MFFSVASRSFGLVKSAGAKAPDSKVKRQGYATTLPPAKASDRKKYDKHLAKAEKIKAGLSPNCKTANTLNPSQGKTAGESVRWLGRQDPRESWFQRAVGARFGL